VLPSGFTSKIKSMNAGEAEIEEAYAPMSVSMTLEDDIDISRGNMIVRTKNQPETSQEFDVMLCWLNNDTAKPRAKYLIRHTSNEQSAVIKEVVYKMDINSFERNNEDKELKMNDICRAKIHTSSRLMIDSYRDNRNTGSVILIDPATNETVAAGMIV
jgi:sulfate adenylyltransferase subunit 1